MAAPVLMNGEIILPCINTIAFMGVTSGATSSRATAREFSNWIGKRLKKHVSALNAEAALGNLDFVTVISPGQLQ